MKIESIRIKNFKAYKDVEIRNLPSMCVFVGANGVGKSTLFSIFAFLKTAFASNVTVALEELGGEKGLDEVRTRGSVEPIEIRLQFRENQYAPLVTYELIFNTHGGKVVIERELLQYRSESHGRLWKFLDFSHGRGVAITNENALAASANANQQAESTPQVLKSADILAIKGLSQFSNYPIVAALGNLIENWYISDINMEQARRATEQKQARHLSSDGGNLALVLKYYKEHKPDVLERIMQQLRKSIPGIDSVSTYMMEGKVHMAFKDESYAIPFLARNISDGTLKILAYLTLLNDPERPPLLCIEEPENQLHHDLLYRLAEHFRLYAGERGQVFISTHSPDFLNALRPEEVFLIRKKGGQSHISCLGNDEQIRYYCDNGDQLGYLWKEGLFHYAQF